MEASKHHRDADYIPIWKREEKNEAVSSTCNYPNCISKMYQTFCLQALLISCATSIINLYISNSSPLFHVLVVT